MNRYRFLVLVPLFLALIGIHSAGAGELSASGRGRGVPLADLPDELKDLRPRDNFVPSDKAAAGVLERIAGHVVVLHSESNESYFAAAGDAIFEDDVIHTLKGSRCRLKFTTQDMVSLGEDTLIHIQDYLDAPEQKEKATYFNMLKGKAMFYVIRLFQYQAVSTKVSTQTAIVGVRGTKFGVEVRPTAANLAQAMPVYLADASGGGAHYLAAADPVRVETVVHGFSGQVEVTSPVDGSSQMVDANQSLVLTPQGAGNVEPMDPRVMSQFLSETTVPDTDESVSDDGSDTGSEAGTADESGEESSDEGEDTGEGADEGSGEGETAGDTGTTEDTGTTSDTGTSTADSGEGGDSVAEPVLQTAAQTTTTTYMAPPPENPDPIDTGTTEEDYTLTPTDSGTTTPTTTTPGFEKPWGHLAGIAYTSGKQEALINLHLQDFADGGLMGLIGLRLPAFDKAQLRTGSAGTAGFLEYARIFGAAADLGTTRPVSHTPLGSTAYMEWGTWSVDPFTLYLNGTPLQYSTLGGYYLLGEATPPFDRTTYPNLAGKRGLYTGNAWGTYFDGTQGTLMTGKVSCDLFWGDDGRFKDFNLKVWENESSQSGRHLFILGGMGIITDGVLRITDNALWELYNGSRAFDPHSRLVSASLFGPAAEYLGGTFAAQVDPRSGYADSVSGVFQAGRGTAQDVPALPRPDGTMAHLAAIVTDNGYPAPTYFDAFVSRSPQNPTGGIIIRAASLRNPTTDFLAVQDVLLGDDYIPYLNSATVQGKNGSFGTTHPVIPVEIGPYGYATNPEINEYMEWGCWYTIRPFAVLDGTNPVGYEMQKGYYLMGEATAMSDLGPLTGIGEYSGTAHGTYWDRSGGVDLTGIMECEIFFNPVEVSVSDFVLYAWDQAYASPGGKYVMIDIPEVVTLTDNSFNLSGLGTWQFSDGTTVYTPTQTRLTGTLFGPGAEYVGGAWGLLGTDGSGGQMSVAGIYQGDMQIFVTDMGYFTALIADNAYYSGYMDAFASAGAQNFNLPNGVTAQSLKNGGADFMELTAQVEVYENPYLGKAVIRGAAGDYGTGKPLSINSMVPTDPADPYNSLGEYMEWGTWSVANPVAVSDGAGTYDYNVLTGYYVYGEQTPAENMADLAAAGMTGMYSGKAMGAYAHSDGMYTTVTPMAGDVSCNVNFTTNSVTNFNLMVWENQASQTGAHAFIQNGAGSISGAEFVLNPGAGTWEMFDGAAAATVGARQAAGSFYGPRAEYMGGNWAMRGSSAQNVADSATGIFLGEMPH